MQAISTLELQIQPRGFRAKDQTFGLTADLTTKFQPAHPVEEPAHIHLLLALPEGLELYFQELALKVTEEDRLRLIRITGKLEEQAATQIACLPHRQV